MKINPSTYDYVMYVDASGDDGFKFDGGSSVCYAAAALLVKQEDIEHNLSVLNAIKKVLGCKPEDEVKYSRVRRHRRADEAFKLLEDIRGKMSCYIIFKKEVDESEYIGNKLMSVVCHKMALHSIDFYDFPPESQILVAIDRMKQTEEQPLEFLLNSDNETNHDRGFNVDTTFRDSKDSNFLLIQIADLLCGAIREHFEQYETNEDMLYFSRTCPMCKRLLTMKKGHAHPMCRKGRSRSENIVRSKRLKHILPLLPIPPGKRSFEMLDYFFMEPITSMDKHFYMVCPKI